MKVIIIEDEAPLASGLAASLKKIRPGIEILSIAPDTVSAGKAITDNPDADIIFADIRLEDGYSFDVFDKVDTSAMIVFTTAYDEYALRAFDYECIDYILKPYDSKDLEDALSKYERRAARTGIEESRMVSDRLSRNGCPYRERLELFRADSSVIIDTDEICYIEYDLGLVKVFCRDKTLGATNLSVSRLASELNPDCFMKVSRTHIVNLKEVRQIKPTLRRNKVLTLKEPYANVEMEVTAEAVKELRRRILP